MNKKPVGLALATATAILFANTSFADTPASEATAVNGVRCVVTTNHCGLGGACKATKTIYTATVQECTDQKGVPE